MLTGRILIVAFEGWNDATEAASGALKALTEHMSAEILEAVDPEDYYDFQFSRPVAEFDDNGQRYLAWPTTELLQANSEAIKKQPELKDVYLLLGTEPSRRWITFAAEVLEMVQDREIEHVVMLGAMLADVPHSRPVPFFKSSQNLKLQATLGVGASNYEGPVGILAVLAQAFESENIPVLSLWASVPHYVHNSSNPKAALGILNQLEILIGSRFATNELAEQAVEWEKSIDEVAEADDELASYIEQLETSRDALDSEEASGDSLARELEKYLKSRPDAPEAGKA
ncbi:MAG: PAC2 family protein [Aquiluna sp.]|nr:PAC2 family protein [Aquiluna sp.]